VGRFWEARATAEPIGETRKIRANDFLKLWASRILLLTALVCGLATASLAITFDESCESEQPHTKKARASSQRDILTRFRLGSLTTTLPPVDHDDLTLNQDASRRVSLAEMVLRVALEVACIATCIFILFSLIRLFSPLRNGLRSPLFVCPACGHEAGLVSGLTNSQQRSFTTARRSKFHSRPVGSLLSLVQSRGVPSTEGPHHGDS
jgi:hypothetical protein